MSNAQDAFGFGKFVPGFDFLQNLANSAVKGATQTIPQLPNLANWVAPTLNVEELEKRIDELKAVQFWLDQNATALKATIQALEVQKMTLATLKGMNFNMGDVANALKLKAADTVASGVQRAFDTAGTAAQTVGAVAAAARPAARRKPAARAGRATGGRAATAAANPMADPMQWWGSLTQQFQQIATNAMKDAARQSAVDTARNLGSAVAKEAVKSATGMARKVAGDVAGKVARASRQSSTRASTTRASTASQSTPPGASPRRSAGRTTRARKPSST